MSSFIHYIDAHCALGRGLEPSVIGLLAGRKPLSDIIFGQLRDPVRVPYFALPGDEPSGDFYQRLEQLCDSALNASGLGPAERRRTALLMGSSSFDMQVSEAL